MTELSGGTSTTAIEARLSGARDEEARLSILRGALEEREAHLADLREQRDDLETERDRVKREYAEALAPGSVLDADELAARFSLSDLRDKYDEASTSTATLADTEPTLQAGAAPTETATLSTAESERVAELEARLDELPDADRGVFKHQREQIETELAELRGEV